MRTHPAQYRTMAPPRRARALAPIVASIGLALAALLGGLSASTGSSPTLPLALEPAAVIAAEPCVNVGSQGWWNKAGIVVPSKVGSHTHVDTCLPTGIVSGTLNLTIKVTAHDQGAVRWVRACRESSYCQRWDVGSAVFGSTPIGPCADCSRTMTLPINLNAWPSGTQELRLTANVTTNSEGKRHYQSTGWPLHVRSISSSGSCGRCNVFFEARGWYPDHGYANARVTTPLSQVRSGATIKVSLKPGSGGDATKFAGVFIDPDFHGGKSGIVVKTWSGAFTGSVTLPTLSSGPHKLVLVSSDGLNAGVFTYVMP